MSYVRNFCERTVEKRSEKEGKCGRIMIFIIGGYNVDYQKSNLTQYNDTRLNQLLYEWAKNPDASPDCFYYRYSYLSHTTP